MKSLDMDVDKVVITKNFDIDVLMRKICNLFSIL